MWRWDQGRLLYFQFDVLREIAKVLVKFDGVDVSECEELFRKTLMDETGMPFAPSHYTVKRNYSRVFQCAFLANFVEDKLLVTDLCKNLADDVGNLKSADDYLSNYIPKFRFPFPAFAHYNSSEQRVYPFCAILKFLLSRLEMGEEAKISLDDIFSFIVANNCTGFESIDFYKALTPKRYIFEKETDERRQLREMVIFISQLSVLKVYNGCLYLDLIDGDTKNEILEKIAEPEDRIPEVDRTEEFFKMTAISHKIITPTFEVFTPDPADIEFIEGNKRRVEHFRIERSGLLRKYYRQENPDPHCCACGTNMKTKYPWTEYLLEIHHLLPLSSTIAITTKGTSLADIVGLCPSCHRAVHMYYRKWLRANCQSDFKSKIEAHEVFMQATRGIA